MKTVAKNNKDFINSLSASELDLYIAQKLQWKRDNARSRGIEFNMTFQCMKNLMKSTKCYYTGLPLTKGDGKTQHPSDITIDRIDASKGYVKGNVVACSLGANKIKAEFDALGKTGMKIGRNIFDKAIKRMG